MPIHTFRYKLDEEGVKLMKGCATERLIEEQAEAVADAFNEIEVTIDVDDDWGICKITHVNGREVEEY